MVTSFGKLSEMPNGLSTFFIVVGGVLLFGGAWSALAVLVSR